MVRKEVYCVELDKTFPSVSSASKELGIDTSLISRVCTGARKTAGGYRFKYICQDDKMESQKYDTNIATVTTIKVPPDDNRIYIIIDKEANAKAGRTLSGSGMLLYLYFARNQHNYKFTLRRTHVLNETGLSKDGYHRAIKELIAGGYLKPIKNGYLFYEDPDIK